MPPSGICVCSLCIRLKYLDEHGRQQCGSPQPPQVIDRHKLRDEIKRKDAEDNLGSTIAVATLKADHTPSQSTRHIDRPRDTLVVPGKRKRAESLDEGSEQEGCGIVSEASADTRSKRARAAAVAPLDEQRPLYVSYAPLPCVYFTYLTTN